MWKLALYRAGTLQSSTVINTRLRPMELPACQYVMMFVGEHDAMI